MSVKIVSPLLSVNQMPVSNNQMFPFQKVLHAAKTALASNPSLIYLSLDMKKVECLNMKNGSASISTTLHDQNGRVKAAFKGV